MIGRIIRVAVVLAAVLLIFVTPLWSESPSGRELIVSGAVTDGIALVAIVAALITWPRRR